MKLPPDPPRLRDPGSGASDVVRALLDRGASELPDAAQIARVAARVPSGSPPGASAGAGAAGAPAPAAGVLAGAAVGAAIGLAAIGLALVYDAATAPAAPPDPPIASVSSDPPAPFASAARTPQEAPRPPAPAALAGGDPVPQAASAPRSVPARDLPAAERGSQSPPGAGSAGEPGRAAGDPPGGGPGVEGRLEREVDLLQRARAAGPAEALAIVREHEQRFPDGALVQEREVIAVGALIGLGRASEARARAARFVERFPRSAYRPRIDALVPGLGAGDPEDAGRTGGGER